MLLKYLNLQFLKMYYMYMFIYTFYLIFSEYCERNMHAFMIRKGFNAIKISIWGNLYLR